MLWGMVIEGWGLQKPLSVMVSSLLLDFFLFSNAKGRVRATSRGPLSHIRDDRSWVRVRGNHGAVKANSWKTDGVWMEAGDGFIAVKVKNRETSYAWSNPTTVSCKIGREFPSGCRKKERSNGKGILVFPGHLASPTRKQLCLQANSWVVDPDLGDFVPYNICGI
ncbi:hypothetical protein V6N13_124782 [Hibiscus sabdariffa]